MKTNLTNYGKNSAMFDSFKSWESFTRELSAEENRETLLNLLHINIRSLQKHWDELILYIKDELSRLDVIILTETNIDESSCATFSIPGFSSCKLCREKRRGGGVLVFISNN